MVPVSQMISYWLRCGAVQPQSNTAERFPGNHKVPEQATMVSTLLKVTWLHMTFSGWIHPKAHRMADNGYQPWSPKQPIGSLDLSVRPLPPWSHASSGALKVKDAETRCTSPRTFFRSFRSISLVLHRFWFWEALLFHAGLTCFRCWYLTETNCSTNWLVYSTTPPKALDHGQILGLRPKNKPQAIRASLAWIVPVIQLSS